MLRDALRRLMWLGPTVFALTVPSFWLLAKTTDRGRDLRNELPIFFNPKPEGVRERALASLRHTTDPRPDDLPVTSLARLGGAALPQVLPLFDALAPDARGRAALALAPVAERMGIGTPSDFESSEAAALFFSRFWQEHSIDYKPAISRRAVRRFAEHPSPLRRAEVIELDTYALEDVIEAMSDARRAGDVPLVAHLAGVASHVTGNPWTVPPNASAAAARRLVREWETWWVDNRHDYVAFSGTTRLGATLFETRYGRWVEDLSRRGLGTMKSGRSVARTLAARAPRTAGLLLAALLLGYPAALALGVFSSVERRSRLGAAVPLAGALIGSAGVVGVCALMGALLPLGAAATAGFWIALVSAAEPAQTLRDTHERIVETPWQRTALAMGASRSRIAWKSLRLLVPLAAAAGLADLPALLTAAFVLEKACSVHGLGEITVTAVRSGDLALLLALSILLGGAFGVAQLLSDLLQSALDARPELARAGKRIR